MDLGLAGKRALVTGSTAGIGFAVARQLAGEGAFVYVNGRTEARVQKAVAEIGPNAEGVGAIPRLGGLAYTYLKRRLQQWGEGYHGALQLPMPHIATQLSRDQVEALASYLSFVK